MRENSDQVGHKQAFKATEDGWRVEILFFKKVEAMYYPFSKNKGADQLCCYCTADLRLCFCIGKNPVFS